MINNLIAELKTEVQKLRSENNFKNGLISILSHDSKEIFGSILWLIDGFEKKTISEEDFFKLLPTVKRDSIKNLQTVQNATEWLKSQYGEFEAKVVKINILNLFQSLKETYAHKLQKKNISLQFKGDLDQTFNADPLLLEFILDKLVSNAIKYSSSGQDVFLKFYKEKDQAVISITDHGTGISEKNLDTVFSYDNPVFEGTDGEIGAGLSLKIVDNFVSLMNGSMKIISSESKGTTVCIFLPQI